MTKDAGLRNSQTSLNNFYIFYNNDQFGSLEPCGCRITPIGGIYRRYNAIVKVPKEKRILLEAGNLFFKSAEAPHYWLGQWFEQAKGMIEAFNLMNVSAATIGDTDFALGIDKFLALKKLAKFPFIAANVYKKDSNELFLPASTIIENQGKKIGVFGLFHPSLHLPPELEARDPIAAAKLQVESLKKQGAQMIIALTHEGYDNDKVLAEQVRGIDLIVGGNSQSFLQTPDTIEKTTIVQLSSQGQMLGYLTYGWQDEHANLKDSIVRELDNNYDTPPAGVENPMKNLIAITNLKMGEINHKLDEDLWLLQKTKNSKYQTFLSCRECHNKQAKFQEEKPHAAAFLTLVAKQQETNKDCLKCHSIGLGESHGFTGLGDALRTDDNKFIDYKKVLQQAGLQNLPGTSVSYRANHARIHQDVARWIASLKNMQIKKVFVGVQCETCHGARPDHPFGDSAKSKPITTQLCLHCHTQDMAPAWYTANGKVNDVVVKKALASMRCPR